MGDKAAPQHVFFTRPKRRQLTGESPQHVFFTAPPKPHLLTGEEMFAGVPPARTGWRYDPVLEIDGVLQVGGFDAETGCTVAATCSPDRARLNKVNHDAVVRGKRSNVSRREPSAEIPHPSHYPPAKGCFCGWYFTSDRTAAEVVILSPPVHPWAPLRGYAVTQIEAQGEVLGSPTVFDPVGTWRAERLRIAGPMYLHLHRASDFERVQSRYPTAQNRWIRKNPALGVRPNSSRKLMQVDEVLATPEGRVSSQDDKLTEMLRTLIQCGLSYPDADMALIIAVTVLHHRYAGRPAGGATVRGLQLLRIAQATADVYLRYESPYRLDAECAAHPDFADLMDPPPAGTVLQTDAILADVTLSVAEKAMAVNTVENLFGWGAMALPEFSDGY